jgi:hypothetical protein
VSAIQHCASEAASPLPYPLQTSIIMEYKPVAVEVTACALASRLKVAGRQKTER